MGEQPARFEQGEQVTIIITGAVDSEWDAIAATGGTELVIGVRLPGSRYLIIPADHPGVRVIHGDITPTVEQMASDAIEYHDEGKCGDAAHEAWVCQYERLKDNAGLRPTLTAAPPA